MDPEKTREVLKACLEVDRRFLRNEGSAGSKFRTLARKMPSMIASEGFIFSLLQLISQLRDKKENSSEYMGLCAYLVTIIRVCEIYGINIFSDVNLNDGCPDKRVFPILIRKLTEISGVDDIKYASLLLEPLIIVKRFAEAMYES